MSRHNRASLPPGEEGRLETLNAKILDALRAGSQTNKLLSLIALDYGRRIRDLRSEGYRIDRQRLDGGLNLYTLLTDEEPVWLVDVKVTLADGSSSIQQVMVEGTEEGLVRNRAQHPATRVKVLASRKLIPTMIHGLWVLI